MSLRTKLFISFGGLIAILLTAQWWMWRNLTQRLDRELNEVAFSVGRDVASFFSLDPTQVPDDVLNIDVQQYETSPNVKKIIKKTLNSETHTWISEGDENDTRFRATFQVIHQDDGKGQYLTKEQIPELVKEKIAEMDKANGTGDGTGQVQELRIGPGLHGEMRVYVLPGSGETVTIEHVGDGTKHSQESSARENQDKTQQTEVEIHTQPLNGNVRVIKNGVLTGKDTHTNPLELNTSTLVLALQEDNLLLGDADDGLATKLIPIPKSGISSSLANTQQQYLLGSMGILVFGLFFAAMAAHRVSQPLQHLAGAATEVGEGRLGLQIEDHQRQDELGVAITAFNKMSLRLKELDDAAQIARQRESLSELGEIANGLAHTIRNPLNTLGLSVEQLASLTSEESGGHELAQMARGQIRRIDQWIRSFLALASQGVAHEEELQFQALIQDVVLEVIQDGSKDVDLDMTFPDEMPCVAGVAPEMRAVLQALIVNAVDASPEEGKVVIAMKMSENALHIDIEDDGPGVDQAIRDKLFTPHVTTKETGSGMGLFLAARIISSRYQGSVQLLDRDSGGTIARVSIPLDRVNQNPPIDHPSQHASDI